MIVGLNELCLYCISGTANKADETVCAPSSQPNEANGSKHATVALIIVIKSYISKICVNPLKVFRDRVRIPVNPAPPPPKRLFVLVS